MNGQWVGEYSGSSSGKIVVNMDRVGSRFRGIAYLHESDPSVPSVAAVFSTADIANSFAFRTQAIHPIDRSTGTPDLQYNAAQKPPKYLGVPAYADIEGSFDDNCLTLSWTTPIGTTGSCSLPRSHAGKASLLDATQQSWEEFKTFLVDLEPGRFIFRGQSSQERLRTSYHRTGRADLMRYLSEDIQTLHRQLSARTRHVFNLLNPVENGAFFNLVQHHGYPTPLLDWTLSPYVAAFFAYRTVREGTTPADQTEFVRIFIFDQMRWKEDFAQILMVAYAGLHFSLGEFLAIENERMIPQQAVSTVTNIDDIESYILQIHSQSKVSYLRAVDIRTSERSKVQRELRSMGITSGSLFPGLDGACEEIKERMFAR